MNIIRYFAKNFRVVLGLVLIWRGVWYGIDALDIWLFEGNHVITMIGGIILGFLLLYLPDHDLKEIERI